MYNIVPFLFSFSFLSFLFFSFKINPHFHSVPLTCMVYPMVPEAYSLQVPSFYIGVFVITTFVHNLVRIVYIVFNLL